MRQKVIPNWRLARCATAVVGGADPDDWFPTTSTQRDRAKRICNSCPLKRVCQDYAREEELEGVWGGRLLGYALVKERGIGGGGSAGPRCPVGHLLYSYFTEETVTTICRVCNNRQRLADEISRLTAAGTPINDISEALSVSIRTVQRHRREEAA